MGYKPIESYGVIGDLHTVALAHDPEKCGAVFPRDKRRRLRGDHAQTIRPGQRLKRRLAA